MSIEKSLKIINKIGEITIPMLKSDQTTSDYFIKMVEEENLSDEDFYKLALIANREKLCKEMKNCLKIEKKKIVNMQYLYQCWKQIVIIIMMVL